VWRIKKITASGYQFRSALKSLQVRKPTACGCVITNSLAILLSTPAWLFKPTQRSVNVQRAWTYTKTLSTIVEYVLSLILLRYPFQVKEESVALRIGFSWFCITVKSSVVSCLWYIVEDWNSQKSCTKAVINATLSHRIPEVGFIPIVELWIHTVHRNKSRDGLLNYCITTW
jgi:hypothetical protein